MISRFVLACTFILNVGGALAQLREFESIDSEVAIERAGEIEVVTTIVVRVDGHKTKGISAVLPLRGDPCANPPRAVGAQIVSITRNGRPEKYIVDRAPPDKPRPNIIRIGSPDRDLPDGEHAFVIRYRAIGQIRVSGPRDEIHWSVAISQTMPIKRASARFRLPGEVEFEKIALFTGRYGAIGNRAEVVEQKAGSATVASVGLLAPKEGITAVLSWKKGVIALPPITDAERAIAKKQSKQAKEFNCLTSSLGGFNLAGALPREFTTWN